MKHSNLTGAVRHLLHSRDYTGHRCRSEFGTGVTWFSEFMRGKREGGDSAVLIQIYETLSGERLIPEGTPTMEPLYSLPKGPRPRKKPCPPLPNKMVRQVE
jgi:hypothetical protein